MEGRVESGGGGRVEGQRRKEEKKEGKERRVEGDKLEESGRSHSSNSMSHKSEYVDLLQIKVKGTQEPILNVY